MCPQLRVLPARHRVIVHLPAQPVKQWVWKLTNRNSRSIARQGSGSASRSVYGGFVEWQKGEKDDGSDSYAVPILPPEAWDLSILSVVLNTKRKKISSREGMRRTVATSCFYDGWLKTVEKDLAEAKEANRQSGF